MQCRTCSTMNDADAVYCIECGSPLAGKQQNGLRKQRGPYWYALLFVPVILIAVAVGYYKFFLPDGVAAEVNSESIRMSELNAAVARMQQGSSGSPWLRYQALNELITERLVMQEAEKAGIRASRDEVSAAVDEARRQSGFDQGTFGREITSRYGSMHEYERFLERRITINRMIAEKVIPRGADAQTSRKAVSQWLQKLSGSASIRIALAEQMPSTGCGCSSGPGDKTGQGHGMPSRGCAMSAKAQDSAVSDSLMPAKEAGLRYWHEKHGPGEISARAADFGCHIQVDIVENGKIIASLRYQDGNISGL